MSTVIKVETEGDFMQGEGPVLSRAMFGAGCFWGVEAAFRQVAGVVEVSCGYAGGQLKDPTYEEVCAGHTGHAEVVEVLFDPRQVSYRQLLEVFWRMHDPTTLNRQGPDVGTQYRSVIFYYGFEQQEQAELSRDSYQLRLSNPIVTQIDPAQQFYRAEEYHQQYFAKHGIAGCHI